MTATQTATHGAIRSLVRSIASSNEADVQRELIEKLGPLVADWMGNDLETNQGRYDNDCNIRALLRAEWRLRAA